MRITELHIAIYKADHDSEVLTKIFHTRTAAQHWIRQLSKYDDWSALLATNNKNGRLIKIQQTFMYI
jgi:hypothetical protein